MQRHSIRDNAFRRKAARQPREAAVNRFSGIEKAPWDTQAPKEFWTEEERRGATRLMAVRVLLWVTVLGTVAALLVALWRVFLEG
ncbi:hypothetical protein [Roseomonas indoligenes]|uniref:Uncharacterized protein n=1 Tax=Roseomonas indoligenes TaxID=2820811 RepID=A0A940MTT8_9PROT|nr:hypothetical protein [Pararoseomonas indoligenes]MBP0493309.1 hypothetical protein [Pararoseomonas indoligenes]